MNFHGRMMNIRDGADGAASIEYKRGHRDARHAAAEIANEADARIAELEAQHGRFRTLLVAIDERLITDPNPVARIVELITDPLRNPEASVMQVARRGVAAPLNVDDFDRDTARRMGLFDE